MASRKLTLHVQILSCAVAGGLLGGIVNALIAPLFGALHITTALGVDIAPPLEKGDLYQKAFWGALWGLAFMLPLRKIIGRWWVRALIYGCLPSLVQIFVIFPLMTPAGIGGIRLGSLMPVFVIISNTLGWSFPAYGWFRLAGYEAQDARRGGVGDLDSALVD